MSSIIDFDVGVRERFWAKVRRGSAEECWTWTGAQRRGYGRFSLGRSNRLAHRISYIMEVGAVPEGMDLDHACRNRLCVNPAHLRAATRSQNAINSKLRTDNTSGYKGVSLHRPTGKWTAYITSRENVDMPYGRKFLGYYETAEDAHRARCIAVEQLHGKFANAGV